MPRPARTEEEVELEKKKIIQIAIEILYEDGFENLSMRKIASRMMMTAANIYNYFSNKDELYIEMRRYAFLDLYDRLYAVYERAQNLEERLKDLIREYVTYGLENKFAYDLLFNLKAPPYDEYYGTPLEEIARRETESSLKVFGLVVQCVREFAEAGGRIPADENTSAIIIWTHLHGAVALHNNTMLSYVSEHPLKTLESIVNYQYFLIFDLLRK